MKRWLKNGFIVGYLSAVLAGVAAHAVQLHANSHPLTYFFVWDMFCGWSAWEQRLHIIGEGESGTLYELAPGPWGEFQPYGDVARHHYDPFVNHAATIAVNTLNHTSHEPIERIFIYEEAWAKKYNLPPEIRQHLTPVPQTRRTYFHLRDIYSADGRPRQRGTSWVDFQTQKALVENTRLQRDIHRSRPVVLFARY